MVHKNLEDNYGAVISANHEALAQILEQVICYCCNFADFAILLFANALSFTPDMSEAPVDRSPIKASDGIQHGEL